MTYPTRRALTADLMLYSQMQGFAYTTLIVLAKDIHDGSSADGSGDTAHLLPSVAGAIYLLVASTTHDFQAGFSLLVDDLCAGQRVFGFGLLVVYGIMLSAAMTVIVSTSENSETVVLNAVTVIFIADLVSPATRKSPLYTIPITRVRVVT